MLKLLGKSILEPILTITQTSDLLFTIGGSAIFMASTWERKPRQNLPMAEIPNEVNRQIFPLRLGFSEKASELGTLCGINIGILTCSPRGQAFSFEQPSFGEVLDNSTHGSVDIVEHIFKASPMLAFVN